MKYLLISLGIISIGIGALGAVLPVLPTTPFLLLGAYLFSKSSEKFDAWFKNTKLYKNNLEDFDKRREMKLKTKLLLMLFSSTMIWLSVFKVGPIYLKLMLILLDIYKYYYFIYRIKTVKESD